MQLKKLFVTSVFLSTILFSSSGQGSLPILSSMEEELDRNMKELKNDEGVQPFFISYGISNIRNMSIEANLGAIYSAAIDSGKSWYSRVMIGNYSISDENYDDPGLLSNYDFSYAALPLDNNKDGIRRALWKSTNNVFQTASKLYKSKIEFLAENENPKLPLADLYKTPVLNRQKLSENELPDFDQKKKSLAKLSEVFLDKTDLWRSMVSFDARKVDHYFINSEGTKIIEPYDFSRLNILCQKLDDQGQFLSVDLNYYHDSTDINISSSVIKNDIDIAYQYMTDISSMEEYSDLYYGPVLIEGAMVSSFFLGQLVGSASSIIGYRPELVRNNQTDMESQINELQKLIVTEAARLGKSDLQVVALPQLKSFNNEKVLGSITIDGEGVIPPDTIILVENGKKIAELAGRTPTLLSPFATGHSKMNFTGLASYKQVTPSTIFVKSTRPTKEADAKNQLLEKVAQLGLDYGIIFRTLNTIGNTTSMFEAYKVYVEDGREERIRVNNLNFGQRNEMLKIALMSEELALANFMNGRDGMGSPISIIAPKVILLDGFELNNTQDKQVRKYQMTIPSPLINN
ncbi:MAG: hypothetical protein RIA69_17715 [Cyclobacteriaceae bacterium]